MKKRKPKKAPAKVVKQAPVAFVAPADTASDYGGLPKRDLKKNLGCG